ncbi:MAG: MOSC domain-containing protein [Actinomycetales bacterium]|nr:MOSC domain-containing protein [Actinomycetales bacterium]
MPITLSGLRRYPVKSCRGESLRSAVVEAWGLAGDRRWMLVDESGARVSAREAHGLLRVVPRLTGSGLRLTWDADAGASAAGAGSPDGASLAPLDVATPTRDSARVVPVHPNRTDLDALSAGEAADAWFSAAAGRAVRLVYLADPSLNVVNPVFGRPGDVTAFTDGYPLLLASASSLAQLNDWMAEEAGAAGPPAVWPLEMERFRPNLVVSGAPAFSEDGWVRLRIGSATFRAVKGCERCVMTTLDPVSGRGGKEPIATLARHRRWDGKVWFAMNVIPDDPGATIAVGDEVEVLETRDASDGPPRPPVEHVHAAHPEAVDAAAVDPTAAAL